MVDPVTINRSLAVPTHGSDVDTWDQPLNNNFGALDTIVGGIANISTTGGAITLNAAQLACGTISITGALTALVTVFFPAVQGWWSIENLTTGNFPVYLQAGAVTQQICAPPAEIVDIQVNTDVVKYRNLGRIGTYEDYAGTSVPDWVANCTIPPYLNCDGSTFSSGTYPRLATILGTTTLPDLRGAIRGTLNQGTGRIPASSGVNGDTRFSFGGSSLSTLGATNLPPYTPTGTINEGVITIGAPFYGGGTVSTISTGGGSFVYPNVVMSGALYATNGTPGALYTITQSGTTFTGNATSGSSAAFTNMPPTTIGGITMIRAG